MSISIPVYNVEHLVKKCIHSIIEQTYKKLEVLLVDDGSTDNSGVIYEEFAKCDSRIKNDGLSIARNRGIDISNGDYIFLWIVMTI